uniref:Uncharacterized protein n=1 Tax=Arion vulgaris TaxID=1028688 RepID=A0A0B7B7T7_9EUPU
MFVNISNILMYRSSSVLHRASTNIRMRVMDSKQKDRKISEGYNDVVLQKNEENPMDC